MTSYLTSNDVTMRISLQIFRNCLDIITAQLPQLKREPFLNITSSLENIQPGGLKMGHQKM